MTRVWSFLTYWYHQTEGCLWNWLTRKVGPRARLDPKLQRLIWRRFKQQRAARKRMSLDQLAIAYGRLLADLYADAQAVETLLSETGYTREIEA